MNNGCFIDFVRVSNKRNFWNKPTYNSFTYFFPHFEPLCFQQGCLKNSCFIKVNSSGNFLAILQLLSSTFFWKIRYILRKNNSVSLFRGHRNLHLKKIQVIYSKSYHEVIPTHPDWFWTHFYSPLVLLGPNIFLMVFIRGW